MKYRAYCTITVSAYCEVEADSEEEALEKASELTPALHFNGSGTYPEENWLVEEPDGEPENIRIEAVE